MDREFTKKPRILCIHGYGTSGKILETMLKVWPEFVLEKMDLVFIDAPFPVVQEPQYFDPPYYEWYQYDEDLKEYKNFDTSIAYIEDRMIELGPFDGVLGFSQVRKRKKFKTAFAYPIGEGCSILTFSLRPFEKGAMVTATLPGMQTQGVALTKVPKIKFVIPMSGAKFGGIYVPSPELAKDAFSSPIDIPSLHTIGEKEGNLEAHFELLKAFVDPVLLYHHEGHVVPHLDENGLKIVLGFLDKIQSLI